MRTPIHLLTPSLAILAALTTACGGGSGRSAEPPEPPMVDVAQPTLSAVSPDHGPAAGGNVVTISGADFDTGDLRVNFDGKGATALALVSSTQITCRAPGGAPGPATVEVVTAGGAAFRSGGYEYTTFVPNDPLHPHQWHLRNTAQHPGSVAGEDANVVPAWNQGYTGEGVRIAIVDDGFEIGHEDLSGNAVPGESWDYVWNDPNPSTGEHGTSVGGVAAAVGGNGIGVTGVAPHAKTVGFNPFHSQSLADLLDALSRDIDRNDVFNCSWGKDAWNGSTLTGWHAPEPGKVAAVTNGVTNGRGGRGCAYLKSAGNAGPVIGACLDGFNSTRGVICVGAVGAQGVVAPYSQPGPMILVCAPSNSVVGSPQIWTTDRTGTLGYHTAPAPTGNYTSAFGGTSSAAPLAAGVVALVLEANPVLRWYDVPLILARSARRCDPTHWDWRTNGAGLWVNRYYGFGCVDASAAVDLARTWTPRPSPITQTTHKAVGMWIPDLGSTYVSDTITVPASTSVKTVWRVTVTLTLSPDHTRATDLHVLLTSPSGIQDEIAYAAMVTGSSVWDSSLSGIPITSWRHLGESPIGTWTLEIRDVNPARSGYWQDWRLEIEGASSSTLSARPQEAATVEKHRVPGAPRPEEPHGVIWFDGARWRHAVRQADLVAEVGSLHRVSALAEYDGVVDCEFVKRGIRVWRLAGDADRATSRLGHAVFRDGARGGGPYRALTGRLIVQLDPALGEDAVEEWESRHGLARIRTLSTGPTWFLYEVSGSDAEPIDLANRLLGEPEVFIAHPDWWTEYALY